MRKSIDIDFHNKFTEQMIELEILTTHNGCNKCKNAIEIIDKVVNKFKGKVKIINTDIVKEPDKVIKYGIMSTPAIIINGKLEFEGTPNENVLDKKIRETLE